MNSINLPLKSGRRCLLAIAFIVILILPTSTLLYGTPSPIHAQPSLLRKSINLSNSTGSSYAPQIATSESKGQVDNDSIYVVWTDNTTGNGDIYIKRSMDNGTTFEDTKNLSNSTNNSTDAQIAINQNNVYVVWTDNTTGKGDIYFKRSMDNGTTFEDTKNLSNDIGSSYGSKIVVSANNVYVVWTDNTTGNGDIYFKRSVDNGATFGSTLNIASNPGKSKDAQIAVYQNNVYVLWSDDTTGNGDIYFRASLDNGTQFIPVGGRKVLAKNDGSSIEPQLAVSPGNLIYGLWRDNTPYDRSENRTAFNVLFRVSNDSGSNFANRNAIGRGVGEFANFAHIATMPSESDSVKKDDAYVVWSDILIRQPRTFEVFFQTITNNGTILSDPINLSNNDGDSIMPEITISNNNNAYVVWSDDSTGTGEIYFTRAK